MTTIRSVKKVTFYKSMIDAAMNAAQGSYPLT
jgi:hypothetical protein